MGSCSGCDTLLAIGEYADAAPSKEQNEQYSEYLKSLDLTETFDVVAEKWDSDSTEIIDAVKELYEQVKFIDNINK